MYKIIISVCILCLCTVFVACKSSKDVEKHPFSCNQIEQFIEYNWVYKRKQDIYTITDASIEAVNNKQIESCLSLKKDTSFLFLVMGQPQEKYETEISYYLTLPCHPNENGIVCKRLSVSYDPKTALLGKFRLLKGYNSH